METPDIPQQFLQFARQICPGFTIDDENKTAVTDLYAYFTKSPSSILNLNKGIWIEGDIGTGKSTLLYIFSKLLSQYRCGFLIHSCPDIAIKYTQGDDLDTYTHGRNCYPSHPVNMGFDELKREIIPAYQYKNALNVMQYILHTRYNLWQKMKIQTYITTNADADEIQDTYGDFIRSRRSEMFNILPLCGKDRRKPNY